jgi:hypothetical protein
MDMTVTEVRPRPTGSAVRRSWARRLGYTAGTTPGRLTMSGVVLVLLGLSLAVSSFGAIQKRAVAVKSLTTVGGSFDASALDIYRSLSDADATAASEFLAVRSDPSTLRARYLEGIARATEALTIASSRSANDPQAAGDLMLLAQQLPVYTGLVETARANNRLGYPLGAGY